MFFERFIGSFVSAIRAAKFLDIRGSTIIWDQVKFLNKDINFHLNKFLLKKTMNKISLFAGNS